MKSKSATKTTKINKHKNRLPYWKGMRDSERKVERPETTERKLR